MVLLKRELYRQVKGPEITQADRCTLVFDTDAKHLYVEREAAHLDATVEGAIEMQTATMDIAGYLQARRPNCRAPRAMAVAEDAFQRDRRYRSAGRLALNVSPAIWAFSATSAWPLPRHAF
jgi:hypothetical protein